MIIAIDPGNIESAYVVLNNKTLRPLEIGKIKNEELLDHLRMDRFITPDGSKDYFVIEMVASYGMAVGQTVFDTCVWIGRFWEAFDSGGKDVELMKRKNVKMNLCLNNTAKDSNIIQALIDRFAPNTSNRGKGRKTEQGWFYGFKADIWQAYALGVTYHDLYIDTVRK